MKKKFSWAPRAHELGFRGGDAVGSRGGYLGALEGDGAELEGEAVGEEDGLERGRAREVLGVVAGAGGPASATGLLAGHGCCGCGAVRRRSGEGLGGLGLTPSPSPGLGGAGGWVARRWASALRDWTFWRLSELGCAMRFSLPP